MKYSNKFHLDLETLCYHYLNLFGERRWLIRSDIERGFIKVDNKVITDPKFEVYEGSTISNKTKSTIITKNMILLIL